MQHQPTESPPAPLNQEVTGEQEASNAQLKERILRLVDRTAGIARGLMKVAIPIMILNLLFAGIGFYYGMLHPELGYWRWIIPSILTITPLIASIVVIYILDTVCSVPQALRSATTDISALAIHHKNKLLRTEDSNKKLTKVQQLKAVGMILWESTDVIDGVSAGAWIVTPFFWILYAGTFIGTFILGGLLTLLMLIHHWLLSS